MVRREHKNGVTTLVIDRPDRRNALNEAVIHGLAEGVAQAADDPDCRCLVLKGSGDHFCAGRDLGDAGRDRPLEPILAYDDLYTSIFERLHRMTKPSIAVVRGYAVAGGFTLAMGCDFVLADVTAVFGALEMRGGFPAAVNTAVLAHRVGPRRALELLLSAGTFPASALHGMGLINRLAKDAAELMTVEAQFVGDLAALDPTAVRLTKETHRAVSTMPFAESLVLAKHLNSLMMASGKIDEAAEKLRRTKKTQTKLA